MERIPISPKLDQDLITIFNQILDGALGDIINLSSDVTTAGGELNSNQVGFNPTTRKLFINIFGNTYSVTLTLT